MNLAAIIVSVIFALGAVQKAQDTREHSVFILVLDEHTHRGIAAVVYINDREGRTKGGKAEFTGLRAGRHRLAIIADDERYMVVNWVIDVPQQESAIFLLRVKAEKP